MLFNGLQSVPRDRTPAERAQHGHGRPSKLRKCNTNYYLFRNEIKRRNCQQLKMSVSIALSLSEQNKRLVKYLDLRLAKKCHS